MKKTASYKSLVDDLEGFLGKDGSSVKAAEHQGSTESPAPASQGTDEEVKDILPDGSHERGSTPTNDITGKPGVPTGTPVPGQPSPPTEEPQKEETSPESKVASARNGEIEKVAKGQDKFASILAELRGEEITEPTHKRAGEAATPSDAKSDPEIDDLSGNGNGGSEPKNTENTSGNPKKEEGAGSNNEPGCSMKEAGLNDEDIIALTGKVAQFVEDQQYASAMAGQLIENTFGIRTTGQKTASAVKSTTNQQKLAYAELETRVNRKVAELAAQGYSRDQIAATIQKIAMDEGAALVEGEAPPMEEGPPMEGAPEGPPMEGAPEGAGNGEVSPEEIVMVLEELVQQGEISPEEAIQAAQVIDEQLTGGAGGDMGGAPAMEGPPAQEGPPSAPEGGQEEEEEPEPEPEEEEEPEEKKEADFRRGQKIASLINQKLASNRGQKTAAAKATPLRNAKVALLRGQNATPASIEAFMSSLGAKKAAGLKVAQTNNPSIQDAFLAIDALVEGRHLTAQKAAEALEDLHLRGDFTKVAAIIKTAQAMDNIKFAAAEPLPPEGGAPMPPMPPEGGPPMPPEGGGAPPSGDPTAAIDQLLGALEQLVMAGVIPEEQAIQMVQSLGIAPPGPEGAGGPPPGGGMPPAGPAAPAPGGEGPPMV